MNMQDQVKTRKNLKVNFKKVYEVNASSNHKENLQKIF